MKKKINLFIIFVSIIYSSFQSKATDSIMKESNIEEEQERVLKKITVQDEEIKDILSEFSLTRSGTQSIPKEGRIATNIIVPTLEKGNVMVRLYPREAPLKLETGNLDFEVEVLSYIIKNSNLSVPYPLQTKRGDYILEKKDMRIFIYPILPGNTIEKEELSLDTARLSGEFLSNLLPISTSFISKNTENIPSGDLDYIDHIYELRKEQYKEVKDDKDFISMYLFNQDKELRERLAQTPKGLVHADFFFENFLVAEKNKASLIDFGDAYYGHPVMDVAIGAMEFSAITEEKWNFGFLSTFLKPNMSWLRENKVNPDFFISLMRANCLRFAVYTAPFTLSDKQPLNLNPYIKRFKFLGTEQAQREIRTSFLEHLQTDF